VSEQHAGIVIRHEGIFDIHELAESFAARLAETVGAVYAVLYIRTFDGSDTVLERVGSYALEQDREGRRSFRLGEGLVGQCAKDNKPFMLEELSEHYYHISSGLGEAAPNSLLIAPSAFEGKVIAVMELASFGTFTSAEKQLVFRALETLGARLNDVLSRMENGKLLQESQALTAELQAQSEELQAHQEEMQVTNEHLAEQNRLAEQRSAELEKIQSELEEHAEQLKQSSRYKSEFLANISHELRTPLNGMLILSQMLAENENSNLDIDEQKYAVVIHEAGEDLLGLINDILDLSKVEAGKLDIVMEKISVAELPDLMEHQFSKTAEQKGIKFRVEMSDDCPAFITTDEQRLHQVVRNLLSNAFTFTEQGVVKLTVRKAADDEMTQRLPLHVGKQAIVIAVSDTGIGIPRDKQGLIFEAFQQADGTTSRKYGGTGLGLSISRELTSLLGGCIVVDSAVGEGSTFTVYIPSMVNVGLAIEQGLEPLLPGAAPAEEQNIERGYPDANSPFNRIKGKKVLIVDDDDRNLFALEQTLIREGLQVVTARNGRQGVDMLEQEWNVELVLMDIMMPVLDGYGAIREIRANPAHHKLPIIAITAKAMKQDHEQCLEAGASDYISKPLNTKQLLSLIYVWLTKQDQD
jgi:two-component system chemotaxis sensor kinase CheA